MTPSARVQAAIELLDEIVAAARSGGAAADTLIARYFKSRRYAGAKDRRAVRELVFAAIRRAGDAPASGRAAMLGLATERPDLLDVFDGSIHGPAPPVAGEERAQAGFAPSWLVEGFDPLIERAEQEALIGRAPLDLRVNRLRGDRDAVRACLPEAAPTPHSPIGLRLPEGIPIEGGDLWTSGNIEIQDEGSQLVCLACEASPHQLVVDLCAGAGGKTLALAAEMQDRGRVVACDADRDRLRRIGPRVARMGTTIVEPRLLDAGAERPALADLAGRADLVLVDAPCSGTGTWRRNPEARWRLTPDRLERLVMVQRRLLDLAAELVRPGGHLVYAVCSLLAEEGRDQAAALAGRSSLVSAPLDISAGRAAGPGRLLTPGNDRTDGFFIARWQRPC